MSHPAGRPSRSEGRRRSRSDADEGGRYVGIPQNDPSTCSISRPPVHCPENRVRYKRSEDHMDQRDPGARMGDAPEHILQFFASEHLPERLQVKRYSTTTRRLAPSP